MAIGGLAKFLIRLALLAFAGAAPGVATTQPGAQLDSPNVSIHLQNVPREQILDAFATAAHFKFEHPAAGFWDAGNWPTPAASLDVNKEPFWVALSDLQEATDLGFVIAEPAYGVAAPAEQLQITPTRERGDWGWTGRPEAVCGPILFSVRQVDRMTTVPCGDGGSASDLISLKIQGFLQPDANWTSDEDGCVMTSLKTDQGVELQSQAQPNVSRSAMARGRLWCGFSASAPVNQRIAWVTLQGSCRGTAITSHEKIEIQNAETSPLDQTVGGFAVHLETLRTPRGIEVRLTSKAPTAANDRRAAFQYGRDLAKICENRIKLFDGTGSELHSRGGGFPMPRRNGEVLFTWDYLPIGAPAPLRVVWDAPTAVKTISLPIQIEQIPVP
jgi:hypothetical protein